MAFNRQSGAKLSEQESEILTQLDHSGIAVTSIDKLLGSSEDFQVLASVVSDMATTRSEILSDLRAKANDENELGSKTFNLEMLGGEVRFDAQDIFARFALNESLLRIADAYFGLYVKLRYYNVWHTFASHGSSRESQLWHYDREDNYILKVFLYLEDVDEGAGPFTYAPGSHKKGEYRSLDPEHFLETGVRRSTDSQMKAAYPEDRWMRAVGAKGTIIFADTRGYHKGGEARTKDRIMFTSMYTSPASESKRLIKFPASLDTSSLSERQRRALQC